MVKLSKRMKAVAGMVTSGGVLADVGTDHGYIPIALVQRQKITGAIAMDINKGPLEKAKANIKAYRYQDQIEVRLSDGAQKLNVGEVDALLLSGMGGALMIRILSNRMDVFHSLDEVILQPQAEIHLVRRFLHEQQFVIVNEVFLKEDGKYYVAMKARNLRKMEESERTTMKEKYGLSYDKECYYYYGKDLLNEKHEVLEQFLHREVNMREEIKEKLSQNVTENSMRRIEELNAELAILQEALTFYQ